jgi:hypothetical protein
VEFSSTRFQARNIDHGFYNVHPSAYLEILPKPNNYGADHMRLAVRSAIKFSSTLFAETERCIVRDERRPASIRPLLQAGSGKESYPKPTCLCFVIKAMLISSTRR